MRRRSRAATIDIIDKLVVHWIFKLGLLVQWDIGVHYTFDTNPKGPVTGGESEFVTVQWANIIVDASRMSATLAFHVNRLLDWPIEKIERIVLHELCHIFGKIHDLDNELGVAHLVNAFLYVEDNETSEDYPKPTEDKKEPRQNSPGT